MSRVADLAREEAARAEHDPETASEPVSDPETPPEPEPEPEPEPGDEPATEAQAEPPSPPSPEQVEARVKSWERERDRHFRELQKRDSDRYTESAVCPLCEGHGMIFPQLPEPEQTFRRQAVAQALGGADDPQYLEAPDRHRCDACDGWGKVLTGSRVQEQTTGICKPCNGMGFVAEATAPAPVFPPLTVAPMPQPYVNVTGTNGTADSWGRPLGHRDYGVHPAQVGV